MMITSFFFSKDLSGFRNKTFCRLVGGEFNYYPHEYVPFLFFYFEMHSSCSFIIWTEYLISGILTNFHSQISIQALLYCLILQRQIPVQIVVLCLTLHSRDAQSCFHFFKLSSYFVSFDKLCSIILSGDENLNLPSPDARSDEEP